MCRRGHEYELIDAIRAGKITGHTGADAAAPMFRGRAREYPPTIHSRGYSETREQAMAEFKNQWVS